MATKYVSALNGQQMDAALTDMAYHTSEAFAIGERNGVPVSSGDVAYHNNAKYYAEQASADATEADAAAARAEAAVPPSTAGAVFFDRAQALTDAQKGQAKANIGAGSTNRNLLDNAYFVGGGSQLGDGIFPINQRGQSSYSGGYGIDRWRCWQTSTVTLSATGLTFATGTNGDGLFQYFTQGFYESLYGKTVTVSAIINGQLYSVTGTASADCWIATQFDGDNYIGYICNGNEANFRISLNGGGRSATIQAVKLELGTVSTLANDAPPDFGEELRKCLRYLYAWDIPAYFLTGCLAVAGDATNGSFVVNTPVSMAKSAITASIQGGLTVSAVGPIASIQWATAFGSSVYVAFTVSGTMVAGTMYPISSSSATKFILSCEL